MIRIGLKEGASLLWLLRKCRENEEIWQIFSRVDPDADAFLIELEGQLRHAERLQEEGDYRDQHQGLIEQLCEALRSPFAGGTLGQINLSNLRAAVMTGADMEKFSNALKNRDFFCKCGHKLQQGELGVYQPGSRFAEEGMDPKFSCLRCGIARYAQCNGFHEGKFCDQLVFLTGEQREMLKKLLCETHEGAKSGEVQPAESRPEQPVEIHAFDDRVEPIRVLNEILGENAGPRVRVDDVAPRAGRLAPNRPRDLAEPFWRQLQRGRR